MECQSVNPWLRRLTAAAQDGGLVANRRVPLDFLGVVSVGYLISATAVAGVTVFLMADSAWLIERDHPRIGSVELFGATFWCGWLMIAAPIYSALR